MDKLCFLSLFEEHIDISEAIRGNSEGTETATRVWGVREEPDRDAGQYAMATETFTEAREEPDQDRATSEYLGIPRTIEECQRQTGGRVSSADGTETFTNAEVREEPDEDISRFSVATETFTRVREEPDQDISSSSYLGIPRTIDDLGSH